MYGVGGDKHHVKALSHGAHPPKERFTALGNSPAHYCNCQSSDWQIERSLRIITTANPTWAEYARLLVLFPLPPEIEGTR
jgi:hypothetical protein